MAIQLTASFSTTGSQNSEGRIERDRKSTAVGNSQKTSAQDENQRQDILANGQGLPSVDNTEKDSDNNNNISQAVSRLEDYVQNVQRDLQFSIDKETGDTVISVFDAETKELIRQIPSEELRRIAAEIDNFNGVLINANA